MNKSSYQSSRRKFRFNPEDWRGGRRSVRAFSLVEVLVATSLAVLLLVVLASLANQSMQVSRRSGSSLLALNSGGGAMDILVSDLESLVTPQTNYEYLQTREDTVAGPSGLELKVAQLICISTSPNDVAKDEDRHLAHAINYQIRYDDPVTDGGDKKIFGLYRQSISAEETFSKVLNLSDTYKEYWQAQVSSNPPTRNDFLVGNVVDFQILFYESEANTPANYADKYQPVRLLGVSTYKDGTLYTKKFQWIEITLTTLEEAGAIILNTGAIDLATAKKKYGHTLTRRIALRSY